MLLKAVQFDNVTSKLDSIASFCYRFAQLGTNCSLHKELPTLGLLIFSLIHTLNDNSVTTTFYPTLVDKIEVLGLFIRSQGTIKYFINFCNSEDRCVKKLLFWL